MEVIRIRDSERLQPSHVVLLVLVSATLAGTYWLLGAAETTWLVDGALPWQSESPLRAVVSLVCLGYQFPLIYAGDFKVYILGIGTGLCIFALGIALAMRARSGDEVLDEPRSKDMDRLGKIEIGPRTAAQILLLLFLFWSIASANWSAAPRLAIGGSGLLAIQLLWAFGIGHGLNLRAARLLSRIFIVVSVVSALLAVWYFYGRNPNLRAKFPFGNPVFLAACLIPPILLAVSYFIEKVREFFETRRGACAYGVAFGAMATAILLWAFALAGSRGPGFGLGIGGLAMLFFAFKGRGRLISVGVVAVTVVCSWFYFTSVRDQVSVTGRSETIRLREYAWSYALDMYLEKPLLGYGQAGFVLGGDARSTADVLSDPLVFTARIAHAHNEWLEIMADLGAVGVVLIVMALFLTLRAGMRVADAPGPAWRRWTLIGLMSALVALIVEESGGVGLRVSGVPTIFFACIGLIWALSGTGTSGFMRVCAASKLRRVVASGAIVTIGAATLLVAQMDLQAGLNDFGVRQAIAQGEFEEAINLAESAKARLNPQRALTNLHRLAQAQMLVAQKYNNRADDRERRSREGDFIDQRLALLAANDRQLSDQHCQAGSLALKELVARSPGFIDHGRVAYRVNMIQAKNARAVGDEERSMQFVLAAGAAVERELTRQPFEPILALYYARAVNPVSDLRRVLDLLARPLRYHRIHRQYLDFLGDLARDPAAAGFEEILCGPRDSDAIPENQTEAVATPSPWRPELMRMCATYRFAIGDYDGAAQVLEQATKLYDAMTTGVSLGAASCYAELAEGQFVSQPLNLQATIKSARRALELAPESLAGRKLRTSVQSRMVDFLLAVSDETAAREVVAGLLPVGAQKDVVDRELGMRYRRTCEWLLGRRTAQVLRTPPDDLIEHMQLWVARAIELNPNDYLAHRVAADLAFYSHDDESTAVHLARALEVGLPREMAIQFLRLVVERRPESLRLRQLLANVRTPDADKPEEPPSPFAQP